MSKNRANSAPLKRKGVNPFHVFAEENQLYETLPKIKVKKIQYNEKRCIIYCIIDTLCKFPIINDYII